MAEMTSPQVHAPGFAADYGYGWYIGKASGHLRVAHDGQIPGFRTFMAHYPDDGVDTIILSNLDTTDVEALAKRIEALVYKTTDGEKRTSAVISLTGRRD
jgi:hypothetical protein